MSTNCFCHFNGYEVKDATARNNIESLTSEQSVLSSRVNNLTANSGASTEGNAELIDIRVGYDGTTYSSAGESVRTQISGLHSNISSIIIVPSNVNIINWETLDIGKYQNVDGGLEDNNGYWTSDYIKVKENTSYCFSRTNDLYPVYLGNVLCYDSNKVKVGTAFQNVTTFTTHPGCKYIRVARRFMSANGEGASAGITSENIDEDYIIGKTQLQLGSTPTHIESRKLSEDVSITINSLPKRLTGKICYAIGDSHIENARINKVIEDITGMSVHNYGVGGTRLGDCDGSYTTAICHRVANLPDTAPDLVLILGGCNDCSMVGGTPSGTVGTDTNYDTLAGAVYYIVQTLSEKYPTTPIVFGSMPYRWHDGQRYRFVSNAVVEECKYLGIPCVDGYSCGLNEFNRDVYNYNNDGIHLNELGAERYAMAWLKEIEKVI